MGEGKQLLLWTEGAGRKLQRAPRDRHWRCNIDTAASLGQVLKMQHWYSSICGTGTEDAALIQQQPWDRRWRCNTDTTASVGQALKMQHWYSSIPAKLFRDESRLILIERRSLRRLLMLAQVDKKDYLHSGMKDNFSKTFWMGCRREIGSSKMQ